MQEALKRTGVGRPLLSEGVRAQAARRAKEAITALAQVANDPTTPAGVRVEAAATLLAHATKVTEKKATEKKAA